MKFSLDNKWELQNIVLTREGPRTRCGFFQMKTPTGGTVYVGGFTVESPSTTEPWHYLFEQSTTTLEVTLRVYTEEFSELFSFALGVMQQDPVITWGVLNNQLMISSPSFSATLFGMPGGGLIAATKTLALDGVTLEVPVGHIANFGVSFVVAVGPIVFSNQPRNDLDPRTFVSDGILQSFPGTVYDVFQGVDGALYVFTSAGAFTVAADALGQGQSPAPFISKIPGINVTRPRNAVATDRGVLVLERDSVLVLNGGSTQRIPVPRWDGFRALSQVTDVDDLRVIGELHATPSGFLIGFRNARGFYIRGDLEAGAISYFFNSSISSTLNLVGTLRSRDGEGIVITNSAVLADWMAGERDPGNVEIVAVAVGRLPCDPADHPIVRRVTVPSESIGSTAAVNVSGTSDSDIVPTLTGDVVVGTTLWSAAGTIASRSLRTARLTTNKRITESDVEVSVKGAERRIGDLDVELGGLMRGKRDKQT